MASNPIHKLFCYRPRPLAHQSGFEIRTEQITTPIVVNGRVTDKTVTTSVTEKFSKPTMPIDQSISANDFGLSVKLANNVPLAPVNGFSLNPESPEAMTDFVNSKVAEIRAKQKENVEVPPTVPSDPSPAPSPSVPSNS